MVASKNSSGRNMKISATAQTAAAALVAPFAQLPATTTFADDDKSPHFRHHIEHVLLISIDGFHAVDLSTCVASNLCPHLAGLAQHGTLHHQAVGFVSRLAGAIDRRHFEIHGRLL
jgi:hypothetical protein